MGQKFSDYAKSIGAPLKFGSGANLLNVNIDGTLSGEGTATEIDEVIRKTLAPYESVTYLPEGSPYTSPTITADTPTKVLVPTTIKYINGFTFQDVGGGNIALQKTAVGTQKYTITAYTGMRTGGSNITVTLYMYKNGVTENGISIPRRVGSGTDTGALAIGGVFELAQNDYIEIYIKVSANSTVTFDQLSIDVVERN